MRETESPPIRHEDFQMWQYNNTPEALKVFEMILILLSRLRAGKIMIGEKLRQNIVKNISSGYC